MAKVSNEMLLIIALWKEKLEKRKDVLTEECRNEKAATFALSELGGIEFAENRLVEIISDLEKGKL